MVEVSRRPMTLSHWVQRASAVLVDEGVDQVRVDHLARMLGVSRGSFYWHFTNRDDLLRQVLEAWRSAATDQIIDRFDRQRGEPRALVHELLSLPFRGRAAERAARLELAIRDWARRDPLARNALDEVDARRIGYIAQCFSALGFDIGQARSRAFVLYGYELAESLLPRQGNAGEKAERSALVERLLLGP